MTASILAIAGALISFGIWLWKRRAAKADDPVNQKETSDEKFASSVAKGNSVAVNLQLDSVLRGLQDNGGNSIGQGSGQGGTK